MVMGLRPAAPPTAHRQHRMHPPPPWTASNSSKWAPGAARASQANAKRRPSIDQIFVSAAAAGRGAAPLRAPPPRAPPERPWACGRVGEGATARRGSAPLRTGNRIRILVHTVAAAAAPLRSLRVCDRHGGWPNSRDVSRSQRAARWGAQGRLRRVRGRGRRGQRGMDTQSARTCRRGGAGRAAGELLRQRHDLRHGSALVGAAGRTAGLARAGRSESRHLAPK